MSPRPRRPIALLAMLALAIVVAGPWAPAVAASDTTSLTVDAAELELVRLMNESRGSAGLPAVAVNTAVAAVARARSVDMATKSYFSHTQPDGRKVFDLLNAAGIPWKAAGEVLAWNQWPSLGDSAIVARNSWLDSEPHRAVVLGTGYNAVGVGVAVNASTGKTYWTAVFVVLGTTAAPAPVAAAPAAAPSSADRTRPTVRWGQTTVRAAGSRRVATVRWAGSDTGSGVRNYQLQLRRNGGRWVWVTSATTLGRRHVTVTRGVRYDFRVRARDRAGNVGAWIYQTVRT